MEGFRLSEKKKIKASTAHAETQVHEIHIAAVISE